MRRDALRQHHRDAIVAPHAALLRVPTDIGLRGYRLRDFAAAIRALAMAQISWRADSSGMTSAIRIGHQALRRGRASLAFGSYLLTTTTFERMPWFADATIAQSIATLHSTPDLFCGGRCLSWVLMPNHWHGLVELDDRCTLAAVMNRFKSRTAHVANQLMGRQGRFWARAYHDRAIRCEADAVAAMNYIAQNPVRAGLVARPADYPHGWFPALSHGPRP